MTDDEGPAGGGGASTVLIRRMEARDFAEVYELGRACFAADELSHHSWSMREVAFHLEATPHLAYVAELDGRVAGFALGNETFDVLDDTGHLEWVAVAPGDRRKGLGTSLMETLMDAYRRLGKSVVVADVASDRTSFRSLAGKLGFREGMSVTFCWKKLGEGA